jgi:pimeloyl-ACP methyl ester carboxylesterase
MGFCLGSVIILNFFQKFPDRVNSLLLIEPILKFPKILIPLLIPRVGATFLKFLANHHLLFSLVGSQLIGNEKSINEQIFQGIGRTDPGLSERYLRLLYNKHRNSDYRMLNIDLQNNCVCIVGENTNFLFKKNADSIINHFKIKECFVLAGAGHFVLIEQPDETSDIILNYLKKNKNV